MVYAAVLGEKFTGKGILGQVGIETGIPIGQQSVFLLAFIGFFLFAAVLGTAITSFSFTIASVNFGMIWQPAPNLACFLLSPRN